jgi:Asp-tRNA(Asn)/Glu-tRNA(Gln) amidotransferase A subunit family amidase
VEPEPPTNHHNQGALDFDLLFGGFFWNDIRFISAINVLGLPGAVVPVTLLNGRPIGVQLIAGRYREDLALDTASAIEKRAGTLARRLIASSFAAQVFGIRMRRS